MDLSGLRILVGIVSYGEKNLGYLKKVIANYGQFPGAVEVVVFSEAPKDLPSEVKVVVGMPSDDPWTLPFAHQSWFIREAQNYDLFIYTEDDIEVTGKHLRAFLRVSEFLLPDEVAGFLRFEMTASGGRWMPDAHGPFHWDVRSVVRRGPETVARFTNDHAGFYILTRAQLLRVIASGNYHGVPHVGRYDLPCSASTDPYHGSGLRKVICLSSIEEFLLHHMSNRYAGRLGMAFEIFEEQVRTLASIGRGEHPAVELCDRESRAAQLRWSKDYYEPAAAEVLELVPASALRVLSVGCGSAATELAMKERGLEVTALPLDSVVGARAERCGIEVIYARLDDGPRVLAGRRFDLLYFSNLLQLLPNPEHTVRSYSGLLTPRGVLVISGPNPDYLPYLAGRVFQFGEGRDLADFPRSGLHPVGVFQIQTWLRSSGIHFDRLFWREDSGPRGSDVWLGMQRGAARTLIRIWRSLRSGFLRLDATLWGGPKVGILRPAFTRFRPGWLLAQNWVVRAVNRG